MLPLANRKYYTVKGIKQKSKTTSLSYKAILSRKLTASHFEVLEEIGKGRYGTVFKAKDKGSGKILALKEISFETLLKDDCFDLIKTEIEINTRLIHENIARMYCFFTDATKLTMVMEYISGGDLFTELLNSGGYLCEAEAGFILSELAEALTYLRDRHVIHRDVKPENVLLVRNARGQVVQTKLCDFTWAAHCLHERRITVCGTLQYCAPEVASASDYDNKADLWSVGVLVYQMLTGELVVRGKDLEEVRREMRGLRLAFPEQPKVSKEGKDLVKRLLLKTSEERPGLETIKNHPWVKKNAAKYKASLNK
eukprot:TRINITY_DN1113_c0_g7_i1.p1 TRINITY_DN1113_c0_g7~~TRINITY_DN1113_c0_g7_i1.p1  ORF type:complete len:311 (+),score=100.74 TRINITY_DN1113_c0_g7_i1:197-1129(+)